MPWRLYLVGAFNWTPLPGVWWIRQGPVVKTGRQIIDDRFKHKANLNHSCRRDAPAGRFYLVGAFNWTPLPGVWWIRQGPVVKTGSAISNTIGDSFSFFIWQQIARQQI